MLIARSSNTYRHTGYLFIHCKKRLVIFPSPASRDVAYQTLLGREKLNYSRPGRVWYVTSRMGSGKLLTFFYSVPNFLGFAYRANTRHHFRPVLPMPGFSVSQGQNVCDFVDFVQILLIVPL